MPYGTSRLILAPALLIAGLASAACGASSPTAPAPVSAELAPGRYTLMMYGTATCLGSGPGSVPSSVSLTVTLGPSRYPGMWSLTVPGQPLTGEVGSGHGEVQGYVRGTAVVGSVRFAAGETADATVAFVGTPARDRYEGVLLAGTPRYEGVGAASGAATTCMSNGFTLRRG